MTRPWCSLESVAMSDSTPMRRGSLADLNFERYPVAAVAVFSLWLVLHEVGDEEAVERLRATNVGIKAMRDAAGILDGQQRPVEPRRSSARRLLLSAAADPPSPTQADVP